jgi:hypothetical protein
MFPKREDFRSLQDFLEKCHAVLHKRIREDLPGVKIMDISRFQESHFLLVINEIFSISLCELGSHAKPLFFISIKEVGKNKTITFNFEDLAALYQLFLNLAKNNSFLNSIPLLTSCLAERDRYTETIYFNKNPFSPDI